MKINFNYDKFKGEVEKEGHQVSFNGKYITIEPKNGRDGFRRAWDLIPDDYQYELDFVKMDHFNTHIYSATFRVKDEI